MDTSPQKENGGRSRIVAHLIYASFSRSDHQGGAQSRRAQVVSCRGLRRFIASRFSSVNKARSRIDAARSEEHTSELQSLMRISYAVFCLQKKKTNIHQTKTARIKKS